MKGHRVSGKYTPDHEDRYIGIVVSYPFVVNDTPKVVLLIDGEYHTAAVDDLHYCGYAHVPER